MRPNRPPHVRRARVPWINSQRQLSGSGRPSILAHKKACIEPLAFPSTDQNLDPHVIEVRNVLRRYGHAVRPRNGRNLATGLRDRTDVQEVQGTAIFACALRSCRNMNFDFDLVAELGAKRDFDYSLIGEHDWTAVPSPPVSSKLCETRFRITW